MCVGILNEFSASLDILFCGTIVCCLYPGTFEYTMFIESNANSLKCYFRAIMLASGYFRRNGYDRSRSSAMLVFLLPLRRATHGSTCTKSGCRCYASERPRRRHLGTGMFMIPIHMFNNRRRLRDHDFARSRHLSCFSYCA